MQYRGDNMKDESNRGLVSLLIHSPRNILYILCYVCTDNMIIMYTTFTKAYIKQHRE